MPEESKEQQALMAQMMQEQLMEMENQLAQIEAKKTELQMISESVADLENQKNSELLVPLGSGIFAKAELKDEKNFLVNVGANIIVEKTAKEAKQAIDVQMKELEKAKDMFIDELKKIAP